MKRNVIKKLKLVLIVVLSLIGIFSLTKSAKAATKVNVEKVKTVKVKNVTTTSGTIYWSKVKGAKGYILYKYNTKTKKYSTKVGTTSKTSCTIKKLSPGSNNLYSVVAYKVVSKKTYKSGLSKAARIFTKPNKTSNIKLSDRRDDNIKLSWSKASGADGYMIYTYDSSTKKYTKRGTTTKTSFTTTKLKDATKYSFVVKSYAKESNVYSYGELSSMFTTCTRPDSVPKFNQVKTNTEDSITLSWTKPRVVSGYRVYLFNVDTEKWDLVDDISASSTSCKIENLKPGEAYDIQVRTYIYDEKKNRLYDCEYDIKEMITMPSPVSSLKAASSKIKEKEVTLSWNEVYGANGYYVEKYDFAKKQYIRIANTTNTSYIVKELEGVTKYQFRVISYKIYNANNKEYTSNSEVKNLTIMTKLGNPNNIKVTEKTSSSLSFEWDKVNNAIGYNVYLYDSDGKLIKEDKAVENKYVYSVGYSKVINITIKVEAYYIQSQASSNDSNLNKIVSEQISLDATNVLDKVTGLKRESYGTDYLEISWTKDTYADKYEIYQKNNDEYILVAETTDTKYKITKLESGKYYTFAVRAVKTYEGEELRGDYSEGIELITKHIAPTLTVTLKNVSYLTLSWNKMDNVTGYKIYKLNKDTDNYDLYTTVGSNVTSYNDKNIKKGQSYKYKIRTYKTLNGLTYDGTQCGAVTGVVGLYGIDVSQWQGDIDWSKVKAAGVDYAIIRATTKSTTNGENGTYLKMDTKFTRNMKNAIAAGVKVGVYVYSYATSVSQAKKEAELVLKYIEPYKLTYPVYFDIEDPSRAKSSLKTENTNMTIAFCDTVKAAGYIPGVYSGASYFVNYLNIGSISKYDLWVARYIRTREYKFPSQLADINDYLTLTYQYGGKYTSIKADMWQYSSNGIVSGISGRVDMNYSYKSYN